MSINDDEIEEDRTYPSTDLSSTIDTIQPYYEYIFLYKKDAQTLEPQISLHRVWPPTAPQDSLTYKYEPLPQRIGIDPALPHGFLYRGQGPSRPAMASRVPHPIAIPDRP